MRTELKTKMRAITRYLTATAALVSLALAVNFISAASGTAESGLSKAGLLLEKIVEQRNFFIRFDGLDNFKNALLCDVTGDLGENRVGFLLLEPSGFLKSLVFDRRTGAKVHEDVTIPAKRTRDELTRGGILVADARLVARNIAGLRVEKTNSQSQRKPKPSTARREAMPQSLPSGFGPGGARKSFEAEKILSRMRDEVARNSEVSAMKSDEILERFRSQVGGLRDSSDSAKAVDSQ
jgi:hypothetical protein